MHDGHRERLKKRFLSSGLRGFETHNILELLLFFSIPRTDTNETAHRLLNSFGSLSDVLEAPYDELVKVEGIGPSSALLIKLIPELCRCYLESRGASAENLKRPSTTEEMLKYIMPKMLGKRNEVFVLMCFDNKQKVIFCDTIFEGSVNMTNIDIRKIVQTVLKYNSSAALVAHNHPGGLALPSPDDIVATENIKQVLKSINVELLDHIIISDNESVSMYESGMMR